MFAVRLGQGSRAAGGSGGDMLDLVYVAAAVAALLLFAGYAAILRRL